MPRWRDKKFMYGRLLGFPRHDVPALPTGQKEFEPRLKPAALFNASMILMYPQTSLRTDVALMNKTYKTLNRL
jgi:hypothetical protein